MHMNIKRLGYGAAAAVVLAIGVGAYLAMDHARAPSTAPASSFVLLDGSTRTTADFKGRVTLVNFWATTCAVCVAEMPAIRATWEKYHARGYDTVAVAMQYDPPSSVVRYTETRNLPFQVAIDNTGAVATAWGNVRATPTTFVVNKRGEIVKRYVGEPNFAGLHRLIEQLLIEI